MTLQEKYYAATFSDENLRNMYECRLKERKKSIGRYEENIQNIKMISCRSSGEKENGALSRGKNAVPGRGGCLQGSTWGKFSPSAGGRRTPVRDEHFVFLPLPGMNASAGGKRSIHTRNELEFAAYAAAIFYGVDNKTAHFCTVDGTGHVYLRHYAFQTVLESQVGLL